MNRPTSLFLVIPACAIIVIPSVRTFAAPSSSTSSEPSTRSKPAGAHVAATTKDALAVLMSIPVRREYQQGYKRSLFPHWRDIDDDGCDARQQVLKRDSLTFPQVDYPCKVVEGDWLSPYDGARWTYPSDVDIDHVVALKEAWDSGAWAWKPSRRLAYANDTTDRRSLLAVTDSVNQEKSDKDPSNWLPSRTSYRCTYIANWIAIKARWGLSMDESEHGRLRKMLRGECKGTRMASWTPAPR